MRSSFRCTDPLLRIYSIPICLYKLPSLLQITQPAVKTMQPSGRATHQITHHVCIISTMVRPNNACLRTYIHTSSLRSNLQIIYFSLSIPSHLVSLCVAFSWFMAREKTLFPFSSRVVNPLINCINVLAVGSKKRGRKRGRCFSSF